MVKTTTETKWWETKPFAYGETVIFILIGVVFSYLKPVIGFPFLVGLFSVGCLLIWKAYSNQSVGIPILVNILCVGCLFIWQMRFSESKQLNFATPDALTSPILQNMNIRISDLTRESTTIRNKTFINCRIYGPAIIVLDSNSIVAITRCGFMDTTFDDGFIETTNTRVMGAIRLAECTLTECTFHKIGIIDSPERIQRIKEGFSQKSAK